VVDKYVRINPHYPLIFFDEFLTENKTFLPRGGALSSANRIVERSVNANHVVTVLVSVLLPTVSTFFPPQSEIGIADRHCNNCFAITHKTL
jgi:hypothetical protein